MTALTVGSWSLGDNVHTRRAYLAQLEERARRLERERAEEARRAVREERARIARELHDVVAHHVGAITVQAAGAEAVVEGDPARARAALRVIRETGRQALGEMRALLAVLRSDEEGEMRGERAPQPSMAALDGLIERTHAAGLPVTLEIEGIARPLPELLDVSAYRIVQEALTNALKHAGPARARIAVRYGVDALEVEIRDTGTGPICPVDGVGGGRGLVGMRERVALFGGDADIGAAPGGGFVVRARLPWGAS